MIPPHCPLQNEAKEDNGFCNGDCTSAKIFIKKFPSSRNLGKFCTAVGYELPCCRCLKTLFVLLLKCALPMISGVPRYSQLCRRVNIWPVSSHLSCHGREIFPYGLEGSVTAVPPASCSPSSSLSKLLCIHTE